MERFTISMNSEDIDLFERKRTDLGFSKSAFVRYLIAVNEIECLRLSSTKKSSGKWQK
mgnify:CR=1 FL=1